MKTNKIHNHKKSNAMKKRPQKTIDDYINDNHLNDHLYQLLLNFQDCETHCRSKLKKTPLEIFNTVYSICDELQKESHPEEKVPQILERLREHEKFLLCEANVVLSCVYVILLFSECKNSNLHYAVNRIKQATDCGYLKEFEPLINDELIRIATTTDCFYTLKIQADKILDLTRRKLFYADFLTHYKQIHDTPDIQQQVSVEIDNIQLKIDFSCNNTQTPEQDELGDVDVACIKVRSVVLQKLLKEMQISTANTDLTKIAEVTAFITGGSYQNIYKDMKKGIHFTNFHTKHIENANKIFAKLNISISIDMATQY
jgi:hypothetical protein